MPKALSTLNPAPARDLLDRPEGFGGESTKSSQESSFRESLALAHGESSPRDKIRKQRREDPPATSAQEPHPRDPAPQVAAEKKGANPSRARSLDPQTETQEKARRDEFQDKRLLLTAGMITSTLLEALPKTVGQTLAPAGSATGSSTSTTPAGRLGADGQQDREPAASHDAAQPVVRKGLKQPAGQAGVGLESPASTPSGKPERELLKALQQARKLLAEIHPSPDLKGKSGPLAAGKPAAHAGLPPTGHAEAAQKVQGSPSGASSPPSKVAGGASSNQAAGQGAGEQQASLGQKQPGAGGSGASFGSALTSGASGSTQGSKVSLPSAPSGLSLELLPASVERALKNLRGRLSLRHPELSLHLDPPELGRLHVRLALRAGELKALLTAERHDVGRRLAADLPHLLHLLRESGLQAASVEVRFEHTNPEQGFQQNPFLSEDQGERRDTASRDGEPKQPRPEGLMKSGRRGPSVRRLRSVQGRVDLTV